MASPSLRISTVVQCSSFHKKSLFAGHPKSILFNPVWTHQPPSRAAVFCFSSRRRNSANTPASSRKINKKNSTHKNGEEEDDIDEDAFEALFSQLEEDLKNDDLFGNDGEDDDISEEELAKLERELAEALEDDEFLGAFDSSAGGENKNEEEDDNVDDDDEDGEEVDDDEDEEESPMKLKNWQLRRLACALKNGRRKTSIKNLAADLCLDRAVVLKLLRDPPPNLVMLSAALPDKPVSTILESEEKVMETVPLETPTDAAKPKVELKMPVHEMQSNWSARKRLKKVQVETLEQVYRRTKRPTNAMISSIVHVTNLPRKKVVQWFEDKRAEDGVPQHRLPYQRSATQTVFTS